MITIDVAVKSQKWLKEKDIENFVEKTCQKIIPLTEIKKILTKKFTLEVAVSLVCDRQIKKINFDFRKKNKATDVLSFSNLDEKLIRKKGIKKAAGDSNYLLLGDIVLSYETIKKESLAQKKNFKDHLTHLILHSILHLTGYDHEDKKLSRMGAEEMQNLEIEILRKLKIKNPYQPN